MIGAHLDSADHDSARRFITENTKLLTPPWVPEIVLHLAAELLLIWQKTEDELGEMTCRRPIGLSRGLAARLWRAFCLIALKSVAGKRCWIWAQVLEFLPLQPRKRQRER